MQHSNRTSSYYCNTNSSCDLIRKMYDIPAVTATPTVDLRITFRAGMKLIQQAYEEKHQSLIEEVNTWKWISEEQSAQMTAMAAELARVEDKYAALQKEMAQLEVFRKAIVSMVDQHSGVSLAELEQSILETIEADAENAGAGLDAVADADTSSFILDGGTESPQALYPHQHRSLHEDFSMREQKHSSSATAKGSPQAGSSRPRASTETSTKRSGSISYVAETRTRHQPSSTLLSPSGLSGTRGRAQVLSDSSPNGQTKMHKSDSTDSLRNKRNTISTTSRSIYPNTPLSTGSASKRHSSTTSPLNSRSRSGTASSRVVPASSSFSSNSTPSTSPRQPTTHSSATSVIARTIRQQQQQKEYSANVRNSMSQMATLSGGASSNASHLGSSDRRQASSDSNVSGKTSDLGSTNRRGQRPPSSTAHSFSGLSPAATELLKQQERQQKQEEEKINLQKSPPSYLQQQQQQELHHPSEDENRRRSVVYSQSRSHVKDRSVPTHHQSQTQHSTKSNDTTLDRHHYQSGYESTTRQQSRRQSATSGEKSGTHSSTAGSNGHQSQQSSGGVDANAFTLLYKEIRDSMDTQSFGMFARVVTAFNEGEKTTDETLQEVSMIVQDRGLNQRFRDLIHKAIAEKESQLENGGANATMDGDVTLEIDHSLLLDEDENRIEEVDEDLAEDERSDDLRDRDGDIGLDERFHEGNNSLGRNDSGLSGGNEEDELLSHARDGDLNNLDDADKSRLSIEGPSLLITDGEGLQGMVDSRRSSEWSGKPGH
ncbi:hypothetical protein EC957_004572 [Mortierella hygrophila]|uniref:Uncharacterized protein n=1 Tax=Mortierella hygrophila TaxID=979708 RepID=A0A9P6F1G2_9FUNG|nr:hypothetical protein EC957_004572 [Mortierella hygrophila]